jgi:hypothetical protein
MINKYKILLNKSIRKFKIEIFIKFIFLFEKIKLYLLSLRKFFKKNLSPLLYNENSYDKPFTLNSFLEVFKEGITLYLFYPFKFFPWLYSKPFFNHIINNQIVLILISFYSTITYLIYFYSESNILSSLNVPSQHIELDPALIPKYGMHTLQVTIIILYILYLFYLIIYPIYRSMYSFYKISKVSIEKAIISYRSSKEHLLKNNKDRKELLLQNNEIKYSKYDLEFMIWLCFFPLLTIFIGINKDLNPIMYVTNRYNQFVSKLILDGISSDKPTIAIFKEEISCLVIRKYNSRLICRELYENKYISEEETFKYKVIELNNYPIVTYKTCKELKTVQIEEKLFIEIIC